MKTYKFIVRPLLISIAAVLTIYCVNSQPSERKSDFQEARRVTENNFLIKTLLFEKVNEKNVSQYNYTSQIFTTKPSAQASVVNIHAKFKYNNNSALVKKLYVRASSNGLEWSKYYLLEDMVTDSLNKTSEQAPLNKYVSLWNEDYRYFQFKIKTKDNDLSLKVAEILVNNTDDDDYPSICNCPTLPYK